MAVMSNAVAGRAFAVCCCGDDVLPMSDVRGSFHVWFWNWTGTVIYTILMGMETSPAGKIGGILLFSVCITFWHCVCVNVGELVVSIDSLLGDTAKSVVCYLEYDSPASEQGIACQSYLAVHP